MKQVLYETKKLRIKRAIDNLKSINVSEVDAFLSNYQSIINKESELDVEELIKLLDELEYSMEENDKYFKLINQVKFLKSSINNNELYVNEELILLSRNLINDYISLLNKNPKLRIDDLYSVIYNVIKKEILSNGQSQIIDLIRENELFCYNLNELVKRDIDLLNDSINDIPFLGELNTKVSEISMKGTSSHLVNYDIIELIVKSNNYMEIYNKYLKEVEEISKHISLNLDSISNQGLEENLKSKYDDLMKLKDKSLSSEQRIMKRAQALLLSTLVFGGVFFGIPKVSKNLSKYKIYKTTTEIYVPGEEPKAPLVNYQKKMSQEVTRTLEIGGNLLESERYSDRRAIYIYDLTDILLDSIEDYANIDVDFYSLKSKTNYVYESENAFDVEFMSEGKRRMTIVTQDLTDTDVSIKKAQNIIINVVAYIIYALTLIFGSKISPKNIFGDIIYELRKNRDNVEEFNKVLIVLLDSLKSLDLYLEENKKLILNYEQINKKDLSLYLDESKISEMEQYIDKTNELEDIKEKILVRRRYETRYL